MDGPDQQMPPPVMLGDRRPSRTAAIAVVALVSGVLLVPALMSAPGIGIILAVVIIGVLLWRRKRRLRDLGFRRPRSWTKTIGTGLLIGVAAQFFALVFLDPLLENFTERATDLAEFEGLRGDLGMLAIWLTIVWLFVAFTEEFIFRGFLINELADILGRSDAALYSNLLFSSVLFGLAHWYQGPAGVLSTGLVGFLLGYLFIRNGFNLWLPIFVHGFIDTVGLTLIYLDVI